MDYVFFLVFGGMGGTMGGLRAKEVITLAGTKFVLTHTLMNSTELIETITSLSPPSTPTTSSGILTDLKIGKQNFENRKQIF